jgi:hypothetical protein
MIRTTAVALCLFTVPALAEPPLPVVDVHRPPLAQETAHPSPALAKLAHSAPALAQEPAYPDCGQDKWPCVQRAQPEMIYQSEVCGSIVHRSQQAISDKCHHAYDGPEYLTATKEARKHSINMCIMRETAFDTNNLGTP